ncbi:transcriptional regulator [Nocardioides cavernae]|uniref:Transcriptional regulator n=1 Tax=Nocardioides cavernae TaxID=1921566 RepID=A0ABR8NBY1_9ACTN|nr:BTAD domain-containing putative transcriptional regulator [Nocardioides cavernae]MBD3925658.1 transcriptional regulator [Nocardioides cavernae]MBM7513241.1 DNA-binding SARP family transcriptional activator [Nocardioides cavernae]
MPDVRLHLLGGFELTIDGHRAPTLQPGVQRLLAFVALTVRGVERDFAAQQLWPDSTEQRARANLRSSLWRLRRLDVELVETSPTRLRLAESVWVDTRDVVGELTASGVGRLDSPVAFDFLFVDLLPDWYDDWLTIEREKVRQLTLRMLETQARRALARGDASEAIQLALTAMAIDPLRETPCRLVMEAHLSEGNEFDAQRTLDDYRQRLTCDPRLAVSADALTLLARTPGPPALSVGESVAG